MVLAEKDLKYNEHVIEFGALEHLSDWYLAINPNGVVPSLVDNSQTIIDSSVFAEYLDEVYPTPTLSPSDPVRRAEMRAWMRYFEEVPTVAIRFPSFNKLFQAQISQIDEQVFDSMTSQMPLRKHFYKEMGQSGFSQVKIDESMERLRNCIQRVTSTLEDGRPWILGDQFSIADIVLIPTIVRMVDLELGDVWSDLPVFAGWLHRFMERPSFEVAYYAGTRV